MTKAVGRILLLLAGTRLTSSDLQTFGRWVERNGSRGLADAIQRLRQVASDSELPPHTNVLVPSDVSRRIEQLLIGETGLTKIEAAKRFRAMLSKDFKIVVPPLSRTNFGTWMSRLAAKVPESTLLQAATRVRNERVHAPRLDWPLKR